MLLRRTCDIEQKIRPYRFRGRERKQSSGGRRDIALRMFYRYDAARRDIPSDGKEHDMPASFAGAAMITESAMLIVMTTVIVGHKQCRRIAIDGVGLNQVP